MAIEQTGSVLEFNAIGTGNSGTVSSTITVPADAELVIVTVSGAGPDADYFSGGSMTFTQGGSQVAMVSPTNVGDASAAAWMGAVFYLVSPDTGSNKTLNWDWLGTSSAGDAPVISVTFWKGIDTGDPVRDVDGTQGDLLPFTSPTLTAVSGDLIFAWAYFFSPAGEGTIDSWSNLTLLSQINSTAGGSDGALATGSPSGDTTVEATTGTNVGQGGIIAIVLKEQQAPVVEMVGLVQTQVILQSSTRIISY